MNELYIVIANFLVYVAIFLFLLHKYGKRDISTIMLFFYSISALSSLIYFLTPIYRYSFTALGNKLSLEAFLYLYSVNMLLCLPFRGVKIDNYNIRISKNRIEIIHKLLFISVLFLILSRFTVDNIFSLTNLLEKRNYIYENSVFLGNKIASIFSILFSELPVFLLLLSFYRKYVLQNNTKLFFWSVIIYGINSILLVLLYTSRGGVITTLLELIWIVVLFYKYVGEKTLKRILKYGFMLILILGAYFITVTIQRFGKQSYSEDQYSIQRYAGEPQLNFVSLMYDYTTGNAYGYRPLPLFRRVLGLSYYGYKGSNKYENLRPLDEIHPTYNYVFYQAAGDLYLNWGKIGTLVLCIVFYFFIRQIRKKKLLNIVDLSILLASSMYVSFGVFFPLYRSEAGNFLIIYLIASKIYLRI